MKAFTHVVGTAIPFIEDDVNTDQIAPIGAGARITEDYAQTLFRHRRRGADGAEIPDFTFNLPQFRTGAIVVSGHNFGCGSSRESAVWTFLAIGVTCIITRSFADMYRENCLQNGILPITLPEAQADQLEAAVVAANGAEPFTVDLVSQEIMGPAGLRMSFNISPADRTRLLEGLDDIGLTLKHRAEIEAFEKRMAQQSPWSQRADASSL